MTILSSPEAQQRETSQESTSLPVVAIEQDKDVSRKIPKVLFFYPDFGQIGGIERYILTVTQALKEKGTYQPVVVCSDDTPFYYQLVTAGLHPTGIKTLPLFIKPMLRTLDVPTMFQLLWILFKEKPDLVHVHIGQVENLLFKWLGYPTVYTFHGYGSLYSLENTEGSLKRLGKRLLKPLFTRMIPHLDRIMFVSQAERERMIRERYLPRISPSSILHNAVDIEYLQMRAEGTDIGAFRKPRRIAMNGKVVSFIGRLDENKNPLLFIELAEQLAKYRDLHPIHFLIVGTGPLEEAVLQRIECSPIHELIHFLGYREDIPELLAMSDLAVFLPNMEGFGLGVLESMAIGTPCLAFNTGGIPEILDVPEKDQLLVDPYDFESLWEKAVCLLTLPEEQRAPLVQHLQERAMQFDLPRFVERLEEVYEQTLSPEKQPSFNPLISVILPVYQGEDLILRAVQSVLKQTYPNLELIVVDDGSTDGTLAQLATISDARLKVISQANQGVAHARNKGMAHAQGDYFAFLDADDLWFPDKLEKDVQALDQLPNRECMLYSWYFAVDDQERLVNLSPAYHVSGHAFDAVFQNEGLLLPSTTVMHRSVFETIGGFPVESYHEDRVFFIKAARHFPIYPTQQRNVIYRQSLSGRCRRILQDHETALQAEMSIINTLKAELSENEAGILVSLQIRNLFFRFLMYNFTASARQLAPKIKPELLEDNNKGLLAKLSLRSGLNLLYLCRVLVQSITRHLLYPWWRWKSAPAYQASTIQGPHHADL